MGSTIGVMALAVDFKGRLVVGGNFRRFANQAVPPVIRLNGGEAPSTPLTFSSPPRDQRVPLGANAAFSVTLSGSPTPMYQWLHDGVRIEGATKPTLKLDRVQVSDFGIYSLVASNRFEAVRANATLDVGVFTHPGSLDMTFAPPTTAARTPSWGACAMGG